MVQPEPRRPERWRGRVRGPFSDLSVLAGAGAAIVVGVMFWVSVWIVLSPTSSSLDEVTEVSEAPQPTAVESVAVDEAAADETTVARAFDASEEPERQGTPRSFDEPEMQVAVLPQDEDGDPALREGEDSVYEAAPAEELAVQPGAPAYGPHLYETADVPEETPDLAVVMASGDDPGGPVRSGAAVANAAPGASGAAAASPGLLPTRPGEFVARVDEITLRAGEITVRAEEFATRIEGLTTKIEELEAKLAAADASATARVTASPVALAQRPNQATQPANSARTAQAPATGRAPLVVGPSPSPGTRVAAGHIVVETQARGDAISQIRLVLDGVALPVTLEKQGDTIWRARSSVRVAPGSHTVNVSVVDAQGRVGSYRWQFDATSSAAGTTTGRMNTR